MRDNMMNVLELLTEQHAEVDQLIEKIEKGRGNKAALFVELADKLAAHAAIEEKIFYPGIMTDEHEDVLKESVEEHLAIKRVLADMLALDLDIEEDEKTFDAKLSVLKETVSHHAHEEEEDVLFPKLRRELDADVLAALGNECLAMFEQLIVREPRRNVPAETAEAAPLPAP
jgi:hypothetical protein